MKASLYRGQRVLLFAGHAPAGHALVRPARRSVSDDRIVFAARSTWDDSTPDYRFANGQESGVMVPSMTSPSNARASIGGVSSSGVVLFADGSAMNRSRLGTMSSYGYPG